MLAKTTAKALGGATRIGRPREHELELSVQRLLVS